MSVSSVSESATERYARGVIRWRWPVLLASVVLIAAAAMGAARLKFIDEYRVFFGPDNPQLLAFDEVENIYTKNDNLFFIIEPPSDHADAFTAETLGIVEDLTHPPPQAALTALRAATDLAVKGGDYFGPGGFREMKGLPVVVQSSPASHDPAVARRLWDLSVELTGVDPQRPPAARAESSRRPPA